MVAELGPDLTPNVQMWRNHATNFMRGKNYFLFVGEEGGKLCGFMDFFIFPEPATGTRHCVGQHFYVLPEYRNTSLPGNLYREFFGGAKYFKCKNLEICCFENELSFWKKHKFNVKRLMLRRALKGCG
jgi:GNAT superfamily N-acetyltransferase